MAEGRLVSSQLRLFLDNGLHPTTGNMIVKVKSFNNVKPEATATELYEVANTLASLQTLPLHSIERRDHSHITRF